MFTSFLAWHLHLLQVFKKAPVHVKEEKNGNAISVIALGPKLDMHNDWQLKLWERAARPDILPLPDTFNFVCFFLSTQQLQF